MKYLLIMVLLLISCTKTVITHKTYEDACDKLCNKLYNEKVKDVTQISMEQVCCSCIHDEEE